MPPTSIEPESIGNTPAMALRNVDLPAPFEPITVTKSPSSSVRSTPRRARFSLTLPGKKVFLTPVALSMIFSPSD